MLQEELEGEGEIEDERDGGLECVTLLSRGSAFVHACMCVFVHAHACMWLEGSVALVHMLDSPFAGSVATIVFPWKHCHKLLH